MKSAHPQSAIRSRVLPRALLCLMLSAAAILPASAATLTFAVIDTVPFGARQHHSRVADGLYPALLREISLQSGVPIKVVLVPFARAANLVTAGRVDGTIMFRTSGTDGKTVPLVALFETGQIVQSRPGLALRRKADLAPRLIGRIRGGCKSLAADTSTAWRFYELNSQEQGVAMLAARRIDAFCTVPEALSAALNVAEAPRNIDQREQITISREKVWLLLNPAVPDPLRQKLRDAATRVRESRQMTTIFEQHLGAGYALRLAN